MEHSTSEGVASNSFINEEIYFDYSTHKSDLLITAIASATIAAVTFVQYFAEDSNNVFIAASTASEVFFSCCYIYVLYRLKSGHVPSVGLRKWGDAVMSLRAVVGGVVIYSAMQRSRGGAGEIATGAMMSCLVSVCVSRINAVHSKWSSAAVLLSQATSLFLGAASPSSSSVHMATLAQILCLWMLLVGLQLLLDWHLRVSCECFVAGESLTAGLRARNQEIQALMGNVAHDLKTPLQAFVSELSNISDRDADTRSSLLAMADFMAMMINRSIDYAKAQRGVRLKPSLETVHVTGCVEWVALTIAHSGKAEGVSISAEYSEDLAEVHRWIITDKHWLLENLLCYTSNAVKFVADGSVVIRVTAEGGPEEQEQEQEQQGGRGGSDKDSGGVGGAGAGAGKPSPSPPLPAPHIKFLRFSVIDTGIGIPPDKQAGLFQPFFQAQAGAGGTGLGLYALSKRIEAIGGRYGMTGREDGCQGCCFWFTIPYRPDSEVALAEPRSSPQSLSPAPSSLSPSALSEAGLCQGGVAGSDVYSHQQLLIPSVTYSDCCYSKPLHDRSRASTCSSTSSYGSSSNSGHSSACNSPCKPDATSDVDCAGPRVLLVDDSRMIQKASSRALRREGYRVSSALNGVECLKQLADAAQRNDPFAVVLLDMHMPVLDGLETVRRIRQEERRVAEGAAGTGTGTGTAALGPVELPAVDFPTPRELLAGGGGARQYVIGLSANSDEESIECAAKAGMDNFISKPLRVGDLRGLVEEQLGVRLQM